MKEELRERTTKSIVYIARDGEEFSNKSDCVRHESWLDNQDLRDSLDRYWVKEMHGVPPLVYAGSFTDVPRVFEWYRVPNKEIYDMLVSCFMPEEDTVMDTYPMLVCVVTSNYDCEAWLISMSEVLRDVIPFFEKAGYKMTLTKMEDKNDG